MDDRLVKHLPFANLIRFEHLFGFAVKPQITLGTTAVLFVLAYFQLERTGMLREKKKNSYNVKGITNFVINNALNRVRVSVFPTDKGSESRFRDNTSESHAKIYSRFMHLIKHLIFPSGSSTLMDETMIGIQGSYRKRCSVPQLVERVYVDTISTKYLRIEFLKSHSRELLNSRHTSEKGRLYFTKNFRVNWNKYDDKYSSSSGGVGVGLRWEGRVEKAWGGSKVLRFCINRLESFFPFYGVIKLTQPFSTIYLYTLTYTNTAHLYFSVTHVGYTFALSSFSSSLVSLDLEVRVVQKTSKTIRVASFARFTIPHLFGAFTLLLTGHYSGIKWLEILPCKRTGLNSTTGESNFIIYSDIPITKVQSFVIDTLLRLVTQSGILYPEKEQKAYEWA
ncbi:hypothetical protein V1477_017276 [Vespula maculifrons]|uniref:Uncharacterized protein n=1 Tax=Vespula maculifrons TaxID=7453 RepID=A0ABD2B5J4_VESMC